jgi:cytochrome c-type biogenesis protein CcmH/NrfG
LLLLKCSSVPLRPAASPETSPPQRPSACGRADAEARALEQQRDAKIAALRSELQEHPSDAEGWARLGKAYGHADAVSTASAIDGVSLRP